MKIKSCDYIITVCVKMSELDPTRISGAQELNATLREPVIITPELLLIDNSSQEAERRMAESNENYLSGKTTLIWDCSDARVFLPSPTETVEINTVAATDDPQTYRRMLQEAPYKNAAVMTHIKCGAQGVKKSIDAGETRAHERAGIHRRVHRKLRTHDPIEQAIHSAEHVSEYSPKPVMALVQNHETGEIISVGVFVEGSQTSDRKAITGFDNLLEKAWTRRKELLEEDPRFFEHQLIQNPTTVLLTTDPQPVENRYPSLFGHPNSVFKLLIPRSQDKAIPLSGLRIAADHAEYPLTHAVENYGREEAFSLTDTLIIETKDMRKSEFLANYLLGKQFVADFLRLSQDHQIIIAETRQGKLLDVIRFE